MRDQRRPGDVIIYNWREGRHLLIDVAVINPLCNSNRPNLISQGIGAAATAYGKTKERTYHDLDFTKYEFLPFTIETTGGLSKSAHGFCKELKKRRESLNCESHSDDKRAYTFADPLLVALSVELQRTNSRMILERAPWPENLIQSDIERCKRSVTLRKEKAIQSLHLEKLQPHRMMDRKGEKLSRNKMVGCPKELPIAQEANVFAKQPWQLEKGSIAFQKLSKHWLREECNVPSQTLKVTADRSTLNVVKLQKDVRKSRPPAKPPPEERGHIECHNNIGESSDSVIEERDLAPELIKSQTTSTSTAQARSRSMQNGGVNEMPWEPPDLRRDWGNHRTKQLTSTVDHLPPLLIERGE